MTRSSKSRRLRSKVTRFIQHLYLISGRDLLRPLQAGEGRTAALRQVQLEMMRNSARCYTTINRMFATPIDLGPAGEQGFLILYGTGIRFRSALSAVTAKLGGVDAQVSFAGAQGSLVGLDQVNTLIPRSLIGRGEVDVVLMADGKPANTVRVAIK